MAALRERVAVLELFVRRTIESAPQKEPDINANDNIVYASRLYRLGLFAKYRLLESEFDNG